MPWMADGEADIDGGTRAKAGVGNTDPHGEVGLPKTLRQNDDLVDVYVGAGCFWLIQHELVKWEQTVLGRSPDEITAVVGYAGAALVDLAAGSVGAFSASIVRVPQEVIKQGVQASLYDNSVQAARAIWGGPLRRPRKGVFARFFGNDVDHVGDRHLAD